MKALTDAIEPGSIFKAITASVALMANRELEQRGEAPAFDPDAKMVTDNPYFPGRSKPLKEPSHVYKFLNLNMALKVSSNIYVARLAERMVNRLGPLCIEIASAINLGSAGLFTSKLPGEIPFTAHARKKHPNGTLEWSAPTPYSLAIGHNVQANAIQLVRAWSVIANGGYLVQPTLIRKIVKQLPDGQTRSFSIIQALSG